MPELVIAEGRAVPELVRQLADRVVALKDAGVAAFRFGDLRFRTQFADRAAIDVALSLDRYDEVQLIGDWR